MIAPTSNQHKAGKILWASYRIVWAISGTVFLALALISLAVNEPEHRIIWPGMLWDNSGLVFYMLSLIGAIIFTFRLKHPAKIVPAGCFIMFHIYFYFYAGLTDSFKSFPIEEITLASGERYKLTHDRSLPETSFGLWQHEKGMFWRKKASNMDLVDLYVSDVYPEFALSRNREFLLIKRHKYWTDCFRADTMDMCEDARLFRQNVTETTWHQFSEKMNRL